MQHNFFSVETQHNHLLAPDRDSTTDCTGTTEVQLGKPMSFIGITYRNVGEGYLQDSCITKAHNSMMTAHGSWELEAHYRAYSQLNRLESVLSEKVWSKSLHSSLVGLVSASPRQLVWSQDSFQVNSLLSERNPRLFYCLFQQGGA